MRDQDFQEILRNFYWTMKFNLRLGISTYLSMLNTQVNPGINLNHYWCRALLAQRVQLNAASKWLKKSNYDTKKAEQGKVFTYEKVHSGSAEEN